MAITLAIVPTDDGARLKVLSSNHQYQMDADGEHWIFRYDFLRHEFHEEARNHAEGHFQIQADLLEQDGLPYGKTVARIHFPTGRVSLEAIIRLLVDEFGVRCLSDDELWRPVLRESEEFFLDIAHRPRSRL
jgi:hypothetical protein